MNKIIKVTTPQVQNENISSQRFLASLKIAISTAFWDQVDAITAHLYLISEPGEFEVFANDQKTELKNER